MEHGEPPKRITAKCAVCRLEFTDYESNRRKKKHGVLFCSHACRAAWTGVHNSIARGGDGRRKTKAEKDACNYVRQPNPTRERARQRYAEKRGEILARLKERTRSEKIEVINAYGGKCECCGESHVEFLTIDHTNGDGHVHRKQCGKGRGIYRDLKKRGFPRDGYRLLCLNCNISLGFYGYCPHRPNEARKVDKRAHKPGRPRTVK